MTFYFEEFPQIRYDIKKNGKIEFLTNITLRFKINEILRKRESGYYQYSIEDGEKPDQVAFKIYNDPKLSWILFLTNSIHDPLFDWPLSTNDLIKFIKSKYRSVPAAQAEVHEYRQIVRNQSVRFDGTIISKKTFVIDQTTYNTLGPSEREAISKYDYEIEENDAKRNIKVFPPRNLQKVLSEIRRVLNG
jgi:hypothetical protein